MSLAFPTGQYEVYANDDDVIGLTVAITKPSGYPIVRTDPPFMDAFDEFVEWAAANPAQARILAAAEAAAEQGDNMKPLPEDWVERMTPAKPPMTRCFTESELRARDERIIRETMLYCWNNWYDPHNPNYATIVADEQETP